MKKKKSIMLKEMWSGIKKTAWINSKMSNEQK